MSKKNKKIYHKVGKFPVIIQEDEPSGYLVVCPTLEGCYSQGETVDECLDNIKEAIALCLEDMPEKEKKASLDKKVSLHLVTI